MKPTWSRVLFWAPRILGGLWAAFLGLFALDVFDLGLDFWQTLGALLIHLLPTWLLLLALAIAWRWERAGALLFIALAAVVTFSGATDWPVALFLAAPSLLIGVLFLIDQHYRAGRVHTA
jgi:hypothetical protein